MKTRPRSSFDFEELPPKKKRIFFVITLATPILFLTALEIGLRLFHYGPNLSLFVTETMGGKKYLVMNPEVKRRYFSRVEFTPNTSHDYFLMPKPPGVFRIFCLGGSTTVGFPFGYAGSFATFLRHRLRSVFSDRTIEVINLGMTATNSYTVNDIASEVVNFQPDLLVVYDGHNEFYGALGIASQESIGGSRWTIKLYLDLVHFRLFQLMRSVIQSVSILFGASPEAHETGTMMERLARGQYVAVTSRKYGQCLGNFRSNLEELRDLCVSRHIPVILGTQVSNLRHLSPFVSNFSDGITEEQKKEFESRLLRGAEQFARKHFDDALASFRSASRFDTLRADAHYRIARSLDTLGRKQEARAEYARARDYDELRFRASSDFNDAIRRLEGAAGVVVADVEEFLSRHSPDAIVGHELILEHLHPNLRGYALIASAYAVAMKERGILGSRQEWSRRDTALNEIPGDYRITQLDQRAAALRLHILTTGWPFTSQSLPLEPIPAADTLGQIAAQLVAGGGTWEEAHVKAAEFYQAKRDLNNARAEYRAILDQLPYNVSAYLRLAQLYLFDQRINDAKPLLLESMNVEKTSYACRTLGSMALDEGKPEQAVSYLEDAYRLSEDVQGRISSGYVLGLAYYRAGQPERATRPLEQVLVLNPRFQPARDLLQRIQSTNR